MTDELNPRSSRDDNMMVLGALLGLAYCLAPYVNLQAGEWVAVGLIMVVATTLQPDSPRPWLPAVLDGIWGAGCFIFLLNLFRLVGAGVMAAFGP